MIVEIGHGNSASNRRLYFTIVNARFCYDSGVNLLPDTWYHFVAVVGTDGNTGYLNGAEMTGRHYNLGSDATYTDFFSSVPVQELLSFAYGRYGQQDPFFHGPAIISDVRIYDRALSGQEVQQLFVRCDDPGMFSVESRHDPAASTLVLKWPGSTDYSYCVWTSADLSPANWIPVPGHDKLAGVEGINSVGLDVPPATRGFFRVSAENTQVGGSP